MLELVFRSVHSKEFKSKEEFESKIAYSRVSVEKSGIKMESTGRPISPPIRIITIQNFLVWIP